MTVPLRKRLDREVITGGVAAIVSLVPVFGGDGRIRGAYVEIRRKRHRLRWAIGLPEFEEGPGDQGAWIREKGNLLETPR